MNNIEELKEDNKKVKAESCDNQAQIYENWKQLELKTMIIKFENKLCETQNEIKLTFTENCKLNVTLKNSDSRIKFLEVYQSRF